MDEDSQKLEYINNLSTQFVQELFDTEDDVEPLQKQQFLKILRKYENSYVEKFSKKPEQQALFRSIKQREATNQQQFTKRLSNTQQFNPSQQVPLKGGARIPNVAIGPQNSFERQIPLNQNQFKNHHSFQINANSKYYFPEDHEFSRDENFKKIDKAINPHALARNMDLQKHSEKMLDPINQNQFRGPQNVLTNVAHQSMHQGYNSFYPEYQDGENDHMQGFGRINQGVNDPIILRNVEKLGGIESTIETMERSLKDNEMRFIDFNQRSTLKKNLYQNNLEFEDEFAIKNDGKLSYWSPIRCEFVQDEEDDRRSSSKGRSIESSKKSRSGYEEFILNENYLKEKSKNLQNQLKKKF